jgi:hypothetical protein
MFVRYKTNLTMRYRHPTLASIRRAMGKYKRAEHETHLAKSADYVLEIARVLHEGTTRSTTADRDR